MSDDLELLRTWAKTGSETSFQSLMHRHLALVYSAALRCTSNPSLAEEVTQTVFLKLSEKALELRDGTIVAGWLYRTTFYVATTLLRAKRRREAIEQRIATMPITEDENASPWDSLLPYLDEGMNSLTDPDRDILLLRYLQQKPLKEVGAIVGITEAAAKMRISRALEKLRQFYCRKGITCSSAILTTFLIHHTVNAVPVDLLPKLSQHILPRGFLGASSMPILNLNAPCIIPKIAVALAMAGITASSLYFYSNLKGSDTASPSAANLHIGRLNSHESKLLNLPPAEKDDWNPRLEEAKKQLYLALRKPKKSAAYPQLEVIDALKAFAADGSAAVPLLLEALRTDDRHVQLNGFHALKQLASNGSAAIPGLLQMIRAGDLRGFSVPEFVFLINDLYGSKQSLISFQTLIELMRDVPRPLLTEISSCTASLAPSAPIASKIYRDIVSTMLTDSNFELRLHAAVTLSLISHEREEMQLPHLVAALASRAYQNKEDFEWLSNANEVSRLMQSDGNTPNQANDSFAWKKSIVTALDAIGSDPDKAVSAALYLASHTENEDWREGALLLAGELAPALRLSNAEVDDVHTRNERRTLLKEKLLTDEADLEDLISALEDKNLIDSATENLIRRGPEAKSAIPALQSKLGGWRDYYFIRAIAAIEPKALGPALAIPQSMGEAAIALGELGKKAVWALPLMEESAENCPPEARRALAEAIRSIDETSPLPFFRWREVESALVNVLGANDPYTAEELARRYRQSIDPSESLEWWTRSEIQKLIESVTSLSTETRASLRNDIATKDFSN